MKICIKCKINHTTATQKWCSECKREYDRAYYQDPKNKQRHQERTKKNQKKFIEWFYELKSNPCADCDVQYHPAAMQWDHLPEFEKVDNITNLVRRGNKKLVLEEIKKCELVCANCHAIRTYNRNNLPL